MAANIPFNILVWNALIRVQSVRDVLQYECNLEIISKYLHFYNVIISIADNNKKTNLKCFYMIGNPYI